MSAAHTDADVDRTVEAVDAALEQSLKGGKSARPGVDGIVRGAAPEIVDSVLVDLSRIGEAVVKGAEIGGHAGQHHCHRRLDPLPQRSLGIAAIGRGQVPCDFLGRGSSHRDGREEAGLVAG